MKIVEFCEQAEPIRETSFRDPTHYSDFMLIMLPPDWTSFREFLPFFFIFDRFIKNNDWWIDIIFVDWDLLNWSTFVLWVNVTRSRMNTKRVIYKLHYVPHWDKFSRGLFFALNHCRLAGKSTHFAIWVLVAWIKILLGSVA